MSRCAESLSLNTSRPSCCLSAGLATTSMPFIFGRWPRGDDSGACDSSSRQRRSTSRAQKKPHGRSASTRLALTDSAALGGEMSLHGSSVKVAPHFVLIKVDLVILVQPRRVHDILHALLGNPGHRKADAPGDHRSARARDATGCNFQQVDDEQG